MATGELEIAAVLPGARFGRLVVVRHEENQKGRRIWLCVCDCGQLASVSTRLLTTGDTRSCGCLRSAVGRMRALMTLRIA